MAAVAEPGGWRPQKPGDMVADDDAGKLLEMFVGRQANTKRDAISADIICQ